MIEVILYAAAVYAVIGIAFLSVTMIFGGYSVQVQTFRVDRLTGVREEIKPRWWEWAMGVTFSMASIIVKWPIIMGHILSSGGR